MLRTRTLQALTAAGLGALLCFPACSDEETTTIDSVDAQAPDSATDAEPTDSAANDAAELDVAPDAPTGWNIRSTCAPFTTSRVTLGDDGQSLLVLADFDGDERLDAIRTRAWSNLEHWGPGRIELYPGLGNGSFNAPVSFETGGIPINAVAGDFDGDGLADLAVKVSIAGDHARLLLLRGDARDGLQQPVVYYDPSPYLGNDLAAQDMDRDGFDDLIVSRQAPDQRIDVLFGGSLPFRSLASSGTLSEEVSGVALADLDGDGDKDAIAATVSGWDVLINDGKGALARNFHADADVVGSSTPSALDVDRDGTDELVVLRHDQATPTVRVNAYRYVPRVRAFARKELFEAPWLIDLVVGDVDDDGRKDVALLTGEQTELLLLDADGLRHAVVPSTTGQLALGDVTGDGLTDLVFGTTWGTEVFPRVRDRCDPPPASCEAGDTYAETIQPLRLSPERMLLGDVNGDLTTDIVLLESTRVGVLLTDTLGRFEDAALIPLRSMGATLADLDADGGRVLVLVDGSAGWTEVRSATDIERVKPPRFPSLIDVSSGDFDCDGEDDLVFVRGTYPLDLIFVPRGDASDAFSWAGVDSMFGVTIVRATDFNDDGCTDLMVRPNGLMAPPCILKAPIRTGSLCSEVNVLSPLLDTGDVDGDHMQELLVQKWPTTLALWDDEQGSYRELLTPDYGWFTARLMRSARNPPDLLVAAKGGEVRVYGTDGTAALKPDALRVVRQSRRDTSLVEAADLDGDGSEEVLGVALTPSPSLSVLRSCKK